MISIICVYNKKDVFEGVLLKSLSSQTAKFELIAVDNSMNQHTSVAAALNFGGTRATGDYILFVHQDVEFSSMDWLYNFEKHLESIHDLGVAGVNGARVIGDKTFESHLVGHIKSGEEDWGEPINSPVSVQTIDELLLAIPRAVFMKYKFDEKKFDFIHLFGADYCLSMIKNGYGVYVIPAYLWHKSTGYFWGIDKYRIRLFLKHLNSVPIFTTCGEISYKTILKIILVALLPKNIALVFRGVRNKLMGRKTTGRGLY